MIIYQEHDKLPYYEFFIIEVVQEFGFDGTFCFLNEALFDSFQLVCVFHTKMIIYPCGTQSRI